MSPEKTKKILFVDDENNVLDGIKRQLRNKFDLYTACGAEKALEIIHQAGPFAVVISDLRMSPMDGMEFINEVRKISPDTVCVILTGYADLEAAVKAVNEKKIFRFLTKPCPTDELIDTIQACFIQYSKAMEMNRYTYTTYVEDGKPVRTDRSRGCLAVTGYNPQDFINDPELFLNMVLPEYRILVQQQVEQIIQGIEVAPIELRVTKRDGTVIWIRDTIIPHTDRHGKVVRYDGYVQDITERKQILQALEKSESRYQRMVANMPGVVFQMHKARDGKVSFIFLSSRTETFLDADPQTLMNNPKIFFDSIEPSDAAELEKLLESSAAALSPLEWTGKWTRKNSDIWLKMIARPERQEDGNIHFDGLLLDVTEQRKADLQIRQLAKFPSENPNPVLRIDSEGTIIYANKASEPMLSRWGTKVGSRIPDDLLQMAVATKALGTYDCVEVKCKERIFSTVFAPISEYDYVNIYARDITEAKLAEMELIKANKILKEHDRLKSEFVSTVSHELRTPLCIFKNIISNALAGVTGKISKDLRKSLEMADRSIDRLSRIIADFLDISRIESGNMQLEKQKISIQSIINDVVESLRPLADVKKIELTKHLPSEDIVINVDRDRIVQVLTNLLGNAVKFIQTKGRIDLEVIEREDELHISVTDNGPGLTHEQMQRIFDRFIQIHLVAGPGEHGTGLGLTIAKQLVEMHGGRIWVDSVPGQGACFHFALPKFDPVSDPEPDTLQKIKHTLTNENQDRS